MAHSSQRRKSRKPSKDYPLTPRGDGRWCKKIRGRIVYFTGTADEALNEWLRVKDDLLAGKKPRENGGDGITVDEAVNRFLEAKRGLVDSGELAPRTWDEYRQTAAKIKKVFGGWRVVSDLRADDFDELRAAFAANRGPVSLGNDIQRTKILFKYVYDAALIDKPLRYSPTFKKPSQRVLRVEKAKNGPKMFEAAELRRIIDGADPTMKAMTLLGVNCGLGNHDCGSLELRHLDLEAGWLDFPRPKTGIARRGKLWQETTDAIRDALANRSTPKDANDADIVFITKYGGRWAKETRENPVSAEFRKLLKRIDKQAESDAKKKRQEPPEKLYRPNRGFYALRHTFETIAGDSRDQVAVDRVMGHVDASMAANYRQRIDDGRLIAVAEHVRLWLFGKEAAND